MKMSVLKQIIMMSKYMLYGIFLQAFFCGLLLANEGKAQKESIHDIYLAVSFDHVSLKNAIKKIERETSFSFTYNNAFIDIDKAVSVNMKKRSLANLLQQLSKQADVKFTRINNNIHVAKREGKQTVEEIQIAKQDKIISGKVVSAEDSEPLPGVSVIIKGTATGTTTNLNGEYKLSINSNEDILVFSYIGFMSQEVTVGTQSTIDVAMKVDLQQLDEVVVIGFGERNKKDLTGSISTVGAESIEKIGLASPQYALQGNTTGVRVVNTSGNPNEAPQIFVRGIGTWNGDSQPLYVIDGQILEPPRAGNEDMIGGGGLSTPPNLFNLINPNDIESISVLKDASAAAVYGSRAANGVVLITTKKGKEGAPVVEFNTRTGFQNIPTYDLLNTEQFVQLGREMYSNNTNPDITIEQDLYGRDEPDDAIRLTSYNPQFDPQSPYYISDLRTYDWQDELVNKNAVSQSYDVKVSGATDRVDYYISAGLYDQEGMIYGNELRRYTGAVNVNVNVTDWLKTGINYKYTNQVSELNIADLQDIADVSPWQPLRDPTHPTGYAPAIYPYLLSDTWTPVKIYGQGSNVNYLAVTDINYRDFTIDRSLGQFYAELKPIKALTIRGSLNLDYTQQDRYSLGVFATNIFRPTGIDPGTEAANAPNSLGQMEHRINNIYNFQSDLTITYDKLFGSKHRVTVTAAVQDQRHTLETENYSTENLTNLSEDPKRNGYGNDVANNSSFYGWGQRFWFGYVARSSYVFDSKYYLDFSFRRDASNGFDDDYRWGNFYSLSGAWRISSEPFFESVTFIDDLKLRGGWGQAGNDQAAVGSYAFLSRVNTGISTYRWGSGNGDGIGNLSLGSVVADFPNASLTWEIATTTYAGFDALLFNNKVNFTMEWYNRITSGILQRVNLPVTVGTNNPLFNIGELQNTGIDLQVGWNDRVGSFNYGITGNISFVNNEVTKLYQGQPLSTDFGRVEEGRSIGHLWGYRVGGIFQSQSEIDAYYSEYEDQTVGNTDYVEPGDLYFLDVGGNPTDEEPFYSTTPDGLINSFDQSEIGNTIPGFTYGINLNAAWKGIDVSFSFYGEGDVEKYNSVRNRFESMSGAGNNYFSTTLNRWTSSNTNTTMPRAVVGDPAGNNRYSDRWIESAAFFRLNNWQVGYSLPDVLLQKVNYTVKSLRVYVGGQNNLYWFKWGGIDPVNDEFPLPKAINFGLNAKF